MSATVQWSGYLAIAVNRRGYIQPGMWKTSAKVSLGKPALGKDEIAVKVYVELPASLFQRPQLEARIAVPDHAVTPLEVDMETRDNIADLIAQNTGFDVRLVPVEGEGR